MNRRGFFGRMIAAAAALFGAKAVEAKPVENKFDALLASASCPFIVSPPIIPTDLLYNGVRVRFIKTTYDLYRRRLVVKGIVNHEDCEQLPYGVFSVPSLLMAVRKPLYLLRTEPDEVIFVRGWPSATPCSSTVTAIDAKKRVVEIAFDFPRAEG